MYIYYFMNCDKSRIHNVMILVHRFISFILVAFLHHLYIFNIVYYSSLFCL